MATTLRGPTEILNICMISDDFLPGRTGVGTHLQSVIHALAERGHEITLVTTRRRGEPRVSQWYGATIYRSFSIRVQGYHLSLARQRDIRKIFARHKPHIVHCHYLSKLLLNALAVAQEQQLKTMLTYHMPVEVLTTAAYMRPFKRVISRMHNKYVNQFDAIVSPSRRLADELSRQGVRTPIKHLSNPIRPVIEDAVLVKRNPESFVVLFAGRLAPEKNIRLLLHAVQEAQSSIRDLSLWIAGEGEMRTSLGRLARDLGILEKTKFLGMLKHTDLAGHYRACDVFVLPSVMETQGLVLMEAMSYAKPVIATTSIIPGPELIEDGVNGYLVDAEDSRPLAEKLVNLSRDPELRARMGAASQARTAEFAEDKIVSALERIYRDVLAS